MYRRFFKRAIDFAVAFLGLLILSPLVILISVYLYFSNKGSIFFTQQRPGKAEQIFSIIKFKTMNDKKDAEGNLLPDKERITPIGSFLRKSSLDEIPQLINVLKGDMSLIGPRPLLVSYLPYYTQREKLRHSVRPGISGLAQVNGRNYLDWNTRLEMDVHYVERQSFVLDIKISLKTLQKVIKREDIVVALDKNVNIPLHIIRRESLKK